MFDLLFFHYWREGLLHAGVLTVLFFFVVVRWYTKRELVFLLLMWIAGAYLLVQGVFMCMSLEDALVQQFTFLKKMGIGWRVFCVSVFYFFCAALFFGPMLKISLKFQKNKKV